MNKSLIAVFLAIFCYLNLAQPSLATPLQLVSTNNSNCGVLSHLSSNNYMLKNTCNKTMIFTIRTFIRLKNCTGSSIITSGCVVYFAERIYDVILGSKGTRVFQSDQQPQIVRERPGPKF